MTLTLRNVRPWGGALADVALAGGRIAAIAPGLPRGGEEIDAAGGVLLPGLHDQHLHLLATAARRQSVSLAGLTDASEIAARLSATPGAALRAVDYDERAAGLPDRTLLDLWAPDRPLRLQDRTGALWALNSAALALLGARDLPPGAERDAAGQPTGRFWREDKWLGQALPGTLPDLAALGRDLAALGLTALTDAGAYNGPQEAALLAGAGLAQRLTLMGREDLPAGAGYARGPLKLLIDERDPPAVAALAARIGVARAQGRAVAAHCVTAGELALFLAALEDSGGARAGDRIEHGGMIPAGFAALIAAQGLRVVTNPAFIHDRGDRYRAEVPPAQWGELYPARSLLAAGIALSAGSDAPYASVDPWAGIRAAVLRRTADGAVLGADEALAPRDALGLYCTGDIAVGAPADLIVCAGTLADVLADLSAERVVLTVVGGAVCHAAG